MSDSALAPSVPPFLQALEDFQKEYSDLERLVDSLFSQLERSTHELSRKAGELARERQIAEERERRLTERERELAQQREENSRLTAKFEQQESRLTEALGSLEEIKARFTEQAGRRREVLEAISPDSPDWSAVRSERDTLRGQLDHAHDELTKLAHLAADLAEARAELLRSREQGIAGAPTTDNASLAALEQERVSLENELELVRSRAAEMQEALEEHKRRLADQQTEFSQELRRLREALERQTETLAAQTASRPLSEIPLPNSAAQGTATVPAANGAAGAASDPVVSSVMAQFAKIQKDLQRRKAKP